MAVVPGEQPPLLMQCRLRAARATSAAPALHQPLLWAWAQALEAPLLGFPLPGT